MSDEIKDAEFQIITAPTALESLERANIDMQIATAKRYPRSLAVVKKKMLDLATLDQETAASCFYRLSRQGRNIEGPTIRLAEIAVSSFGNLRYGARVISNDKKVITAQGYCFDLESNVMSQVEVQRRITDKYGKTYSDDMQVVTGNAACAIAARNAVFKVVPFAFIKPIFSAAKKAAVGDIKTLSERRTAMLKTFAALGVNEKRVLATLDKNGVEEIGLAELEILIGLHNAIEDKEQTVEEAFPSIIIERAKVNGIDKQTPAPAVVPKEETPEPETPKKRGPKKKLEGLNPDEPVQNQVGPNEQKMMMRLEALKLSKDDLVTVARQLDAVDPSEGWDAIGEDRFDVLLREANWSIVEEALKNLEK